MGISYARVTLQFEHDEQAGVPRSMHNNADLKQSGYLLLSAISLQMSQSCMNWEEILYYWGILVQYDKTK